MKAFILAAGLGTRLRPFTCYHPKALAEVGGVPMLARVIDSLKKEGVTDIVVNIHHFGEQIEEYLKTHDFGVNYQISDERKELLDTGGGLLYASPLLFDNNDNVLVHNVDILSNASISSLYDFHRNNNNDVTLLVSDRKSSRKLVFDKNMNLTGWHNLTSGEFKPSGFLNLGENLEFAFSGIYFVNKRTIDAMKNEGRDGSFPIMDFLLENINELKIKGFLASDLKLIDIGKPETIEEANRLFEK